MNIFSETAYVIYDLLIKADGSGSMPVAAAFLGLATRLANWQGTKEETARRRRVEIEIPQ